MDEPAGEPLPQIEVHSPRRLSKPAGPPPPPSVSHLLLFVACCAVYLAVARRLIAADPTPLGLAIVGGYGLCIAGAWFLLCVFLTRCVRATPWPIEPGLWLGAGLGVRLALEILLTLPKRPLFHSTETVLDAVTCLCLVTLLFGRDVTRHWKVIAILLLLGYGLPLAALAVFDVPAALLRFGRPALVVVLLAAGLGLDRRRGMPRTWLHKLGLCIWAAYVLFTAILRLV
jgi:hypothetical protein